MLQLEFDVRCIDQAASLQWLLPVMLLTVPCASVFSQRGRPVTATAKALEAAAAVCEAARRTMRKT